MLFTIFSTVSLLLNVINATPLALQSRDIVSPPITSPVADTVWAVGSKQTITWDTSNLPPASQMTTTTGKVVLGLLKADSENLMLDTPLAQGFLYTAGKVEITVPSVDPGSDYIVVLFGDSGNASPKFTIRPSSQTLAAPPSLSTHGTVPLPNTPSLTIPSISLPPDTTVGSASASLTSSSPSTTPTTPLSSTGSSSGSVSVGASSGSSVASAPSTSPSSNAAVGVKHANLGMLLSAIAALTVISF